MRLSISLFSLAVLAGLVAAAPVRILLPLYPSEADSFLQVDSLALVRPTYLQPL